MYAKAYNTLDWSLNKDNGSCDVTIAPDHPYFEHHQVKEWRVLPGVVYIELMLTGLAQLRPEISIQQITDMVWLRPIRHLGEKTCQLHLSFKTHKNNSGHRITECHLIFAGELCAMAGLCEAEIINQPVLSLQNRDEITERTQDHLTREQVYRAFDNMGIHYGPEFRRISYVQRHQNNALAWLSNNDGTALDWANLLDCSFQTGMAISIGQHQESLMPYSMGMLSFHPGFSLSDSGSAFVLTTKHTPFRTSLTIFDSRYQPMLSVRDLGVKAANF